jgi:hypothetical protein
MQVGSKVKLAENNTAGMVMLSLFIKRLPCPDPDTTYTIKSITSYRCDSCNELHGIVQLEELDIDIMNTGGTPIEMWDELVPPGESADEIINKVLTSAPKVLEPELV